MSKTRAITSCRSAPLHSLSLVRRAAGSESIARFAQTYLPAHFRLPPSPMHEQLVKMLHKATSQRGARLAVAAPRGHAKSTLVSLAFVLWCRSLASVRSFLALTAISESSPGRIHEGRCQPGHPW